MGSINFWASITKDLLMNKNFFYALFFCISLRVEAKEYNALYTSPKAHYSLRVSIGAGDLEGTLTVLRGQQPLAKYIFNGELLDVYWSPSGTYVAINNHYGHAGWWPWIISLKDGRVIRSKTAVNSSDYDRYQDYSYGPDIAEVEKAKLQQTYSGYLDDQMRLGYTSIAYGWKDGDRLLMFHEFPLDKLYEKEGSLLCVYTVVKVGDSLKLLPKYTVIKKIKANREQNNILPQIAKTLFLSVK